MHESMISKKDLIAQEWDLVIVGRGYTGLLNARIKQELGTLPDACLILGSDEMWGEYHPHPMGQFPCLLSLPSFAHRKFPDDKHESFLCSSSFGAQLSSQVIKLQESGKIRFADGWVQSEIELVAGVWTITITRGSETITCITKKIDFCTGPGPGRIPRPNNTKKSDNVKIGGPWGMNVWDNFDVRLWQELVNRSGPKAMIAEDYMCTSSSSGRVVVIVGEGPLAANAVEHALRIDGKQVIWIGRTIELVTRSFPASRRYDELIENISSIRDIEEEELLRDMDQIFENLKPVNSRLHIYLNEVIQVTNDQIFLDGTKETKVLGGLYAAVTSLNFDTLVISASSENELSDVKSLPSLVKSIDPYPINEAERNESKQYWKPIIESGMVVGLVSSDGKVRILGAPSRNRHLFKNIATSFKNESDNYETWHNSLCAQARMDNHAMGITVGATTIAMANEYYCNSTPDQNLNTKLLTDETSQAERKSRIDPYQLVDVASDSECAFAREG